MVLGGFGWFWLVLGGFGSFWVVLARFARFGWFWVVSYFSIGRYNSTRYRKQEILLKYSFKYIGVIPILNFS